MKINELHNSLLIHEHQIKRKEVTEQALRVTEDNFALQTNERFDNKSRRRGGHKVGMIKILVPEGIH